MSVTLGAVLTEQHGFCREMQRLVVSKIGLKCNVICTDLPLVSFLWFAMVGRRSNEKRFASKRDLKPALLY